MATLPPEINTYHCLCTSLLLASTHNLSLLPRRSTTTGGLDQAIILPLPSSPPSTSLSRSPSPNAEKEQQEDGGDDEGDNGDDNEAADRARNYLLVKDLPPEGYTVLLSMTQVPKPTIVRREDGFERRLIWRCGRCRLTVGYELQSENDAMDVDADGGRGKGREYAGKVMYIIPAGIMTTDFMMKRGAAGRGGGMLNENDVGIGVGAFAVLE